MSRSLPPDIRVFERGWLSSNNILLLGNANQGLGATLVDSGYCTHGAQTLALVQQALTGQPLATLVNTHLHSDHCGGNAALQAAYPCLATLIPPGHAEAVRRWDEATLSYTVTGQTCPRFKLDGVLKPGSEIQLGQRRWQVHAAPGHDPHSLILFEPDLRLLISADALWQDGFGVVFPEIEGVHAYSEVGATLDLIESLEPLLVIPGHGAPFTEVAPALARARSRLDYFQSDPKRHARHAAKVLLKFKLLEQQRMALLELQQWAAQTPYLQLLWRSHFAGQEFAQWVDEMLDGLVRAGAANVEQADGLAVVVNR